MLNPNIRKRFTKVLLNRKKYPAPNSFCYNKKKVKAIILGSDPLDNSKSENISLQYNVFGIGSGNNNMFQNIYSNLTHVGLNLENIYVTNVIPFYTVKKLMVNILWNELAAEILPSLITELDTFDKKRKIPVLLTSEIVYTFLLNTFDDYIKARDLYDKFEVLPIPKSQNKLGRKLYPLYQQKTYTLSKKENKKYSEFLKSEIFG